MSCLVNKRNGGTIVQKNHLYEHKICWRNETKKTYCMYRPSEHPKLHDGIVRKLYYMTTSLQSGHVMILDNSRDFWGLVCVRREGVGVCCLFCWGFFYLVISRKILLTLNCHDIWKSAKTAHKIPILWLALGPGNRRNSHQGVKSPTPYFMILFLNLNCQSNLHDRKDKKMCACIFEVAM